MDVHIRQAKGSDLEAIEDMAKDEDFHIGIHNWRLYFETSSDCWQVAENKEKLIVGYKADNLLPGGLAKHAFQLVIREKYRGRGLTRFFDTMHYSPHKIPCTANATHSSLSRYKFDAFGDRLLGFFGHATAPKLARPDVVVGDVDFETLGKSTDAMEEVVKYDGKVCGFERRDFLTEWLLAKRFPCFSRSIVAKFDGTVCGYGTLREYDGYYAVAPLYADRDHVAEWIFYELVKNLHKSTKLYFLTKSSCKILVNLAAIFSMECCDDELRTFTHLEPGMASWDMQKVYAMHDFYPV